MEKPKATHNPDTGLTYPTVFDAFMDSQSRYGLLVGGAGSGKSYTAAQKLLRRMLDEPGARFLVVRKVGATLRRSSFQLFRDLISHLGWSKNFRVNLTERRIESPDNGAVLLFTGIDDPEKIKSIQGISSVWVEEATELEASDFRQLELRVRGHTPGYKQFVLTCNPISDQHWLYERFCAPGLGINDELAVVHSTAYDNPFIDADYLMSLQAGNRQDDDYYRVYTLGLWGTERKKDLFYKAFDLKKHVCHATAPNRELPLHLSFDFNVQPYLTCTVWQIEQKRRYKVARQIDEICLEGPRNTIYDMAEAILTRFGAHWPSGVRIYGDPSGNARTVASELTLFGQLEAGLKSMRPHMCVARKAEGVAARGNWINAVLRSTLYDANGGIKIEIARTCRRTLEDYARVRESQTGTKLKPRIKGDGGFSYELHGHCSDANDYLLCTIFYAHYWGFMETGEVM